MHTTAVSASFAAPPVLSNYIVTRESVDGCFSLNSCPESHPEGQPGDGQGKRWSVYRGLASWNF